MSELVATKEGLDIIVEMIAPTIQKLIAEAIAAERARCAGIVRKNARTHSFNVGGMYIEETIIDVDDCVKEIEDGQ